MSILTRMSDLATLWSFVVALHQIHGSNIITGTVIGLIYGIARWISSTDRARIRV